MIERINRQGTVDLPAFVPLKYHYLLLPDLGEGWNTTHQSSNTR